MKFHENPSNDSRVSPCEQTAGQMEGRRADTTEVIVPFRKFAKALKH
jgi:hypothetical protein